MLNFVLYEIDRLVVFIFILLLQLLLCFKIKNILIRLLPTILFLVTTIVLAIMIFLSSGWDRLGFVVLALFFGQILFACVIGWGVWGIIKKMKKEKATQDLKAFYKEV